MKLVEAIPEVGQLCTKAARPLGLVPTMGALHDGHTALVDRARAENSVVVASIFVNPAQFGPDEDLATYPARLEPDLARLEDAGVDIVFAPPADEMYPDGFETFVDVGRLGAVLEGKFRPNHFRGVATVVCKLLAIVRPDRAYFGQKDAQQLLVVKRLNADLNLGADIVAVPTVRDGDGLALSSRNAHLGVQERRAATVLYRSLCLAKRSWEDGATDAKEVKGRMLAHLEAEPLASVDYVSIANAETMEELDRIAGPTLVSIAVRIGNVRLIDNVEL